MKFLSQIRGYWANKTFHYSVLILIALLGVVIPTWHYQLSIWVTPLILGIIAAALTEQDDSITGRLKTIGLALICFAIATFSIEILFDYPLLFAIGLSLSTFGFIMLGAISSRYASIAFGSLLIAVYTMIGARQSPDFWFQPTLLLAGALWYYLVSVIWLVLFPNRPVQHNLALVFLNIADYFDLKSELFYPVSHVQIQPHRIREANFNAQIVTALNHCKATLLSYSKKGQIHTTSHNFLNTYFLAQDIHERISSTHYRYQELAEHFDRSDILFRFKHLLETQAKACREVARCIKENCEYQHPNTSALALDELHLSMHYLSEHSRPEWKPLFAQLNYLFNNLSTIEKQLNNIGQPESHQFDENQLSDTNPHGLKSMWQRIWSNFSRDSLLFRHAIRMSVALTTGYAILQSFNLELGYWILLTTLFVCQPNFSATRQRITLRVIGTISGLFIGVLLLTLFPSQASQTTMIVISGVMFFAFRNNNYGYATGFITVLVLFCFNQMGAGYAVVLPRLMDTLIGCGLAVLAVSFILPDWHAKRLHKVMAEAIRSNKNYLDQIIVQYRIGKKDSLSYRIARRDAHDQDAALTTAINNMLSEPGKYRKAEEESFRFLTLNHALLSYISAIGAHRTRLDDESIHRLVLDGHRVIHQHFQLLHEQLEHHHNCCDTSHIESTGLEKQLAEWREEDKGSVRLVLQQLHLIHRILPELHSLASKFVARSEPQIPPTS
ncbi:YccS family putative transporter [Vibrio mangrovi]|uniref:Inner membrane protein YccS n=1 Tax=Vibrio mangrovi TaxID=474394 RepID=A0A1Y6IT58_9VIBR|nr:YccS family putative transporter [Vibrio mangrovi]MDW6004571.1 YccS family putative transporter [Vibrio mangrovi]SMS00859.1 Inner membrane protein YccS [Vibrio mangrovi]